jgi:hypothetical protein
LSGINHVVQIGVPGLNIRKVLVRWSQYIPSYWPKLKQHVEKWKGIKEKWKAKRYQDNKASDKAKVLRGQKKRWPSQTWLTRDRVWRHQRRQRSIIVLVTSQSYSPVLWVMFGRSKFFWILIIFISNGENPLHLV